MNHNRKYTRAIGYLLDEVSSAEELLTASPQKVSKYLQSEGVDLKALDSCMDLFAKSLPGRLAMVQASEKQALAAENPAPLRDLSALSDDQLKGKLIEIYGHENLIPLAARTKGALTRKELESLVRDATDEL